MVRVAGAPVMGETVSESGHLSFVMLNQDGVVASKILREWTTRASSGNVIWARKDLGLEIWSRSE